LKGEWKKEGVCTKKEEDLYFRIPHHIPK